MAKQKKIFTKTELQTLTSEEIIERIKYKNYSLLDSFSAEKLRKEMVPVGKACNIAANYFLKSTGVKNTEKHNQAARRKLVKILKKLAPGEYNNIPIDNKNGLIIGFNHPSLGEILRLLLMKLDVMGDKPMYFPVNLPWYEALAPNFDQIKRLNIIITPLITPSTWKKLELKEGTVLYEAGSRIKRDFRDIYTDLSRKAMKEGGVIFVAPSATRQATVFKTEEEYLGEVEPIPTMSMLAKKLYEDPEVNCDFLPLAVLPPEKYKRGLNFYKKYKLIPGKIMTAEEIKKKYFKEKSPERLEGFERDFLQRIAEKLPKSFWY